MHGRPRRPSGDSRAGRRARRSDGRSAVTNVIEATGLTKWYGRRRGILDVDFHVEEKPTGER